MHVVGSVFFTPALLYLQYAVENEELTQHLGAAKDAQRQLTAEVSQTCNLLSVMSYCNTSSVHGHIFSPGPDNIKMEPTITHCFKILL